MYCVVNFGMYDEYDECYWVEIHNDDKTTKSYAVFDSWWSDSETKEEFARRIVDTRWPGIEIDFEKSSFMDLLDE